MQPDRREFIKHLGWLTAVGTGTHQALANEHAEEGHAAGPKDPMGVLVDLTVCIGCRLCEHACKSANGIDPGLLESYDDQSVFAEKRRPGNGSFTVLNSWSDSENPGKPVYAKINCMHCNKPACASACIVGAMRKQEDGAVTYDAWKCIGCRYCMVACPFQIPTYDYDKVLTPLVHKCTFCHEKTMKGERPACVAACPREALTFGKRRQLIGLAHVKIDEHPERYLPEVYGEHEVGGTSWMYISKLPFQQAGFPALGTAAPPVLTEAIQHGVFKYWIAPATWYSFLAGMFWFTGRKGKVRAAEGGATLGVQDSDGHREDSGLESEASGFRGRMLEADGEEDADSDTAVAVAEDREEIHQRGFGGPQDMDDDEIPLSPTISESAMRHGRGHGKEAHHGHLAPLNHKLLTPGVLVLLAMVVVGIGFWIYRMAMGLAATTNLTDARPWGIWIAMDVGSGIALAGGGFISAAIFHIFHRERYHTLARSALITALFGYTFYVPGLLADLGRWYKLPITMWPGCWQGNSVLFEVGMCVMIYLNVQYAELTPIICERLLGEGWFKRFPLIYKATELTRKFLDFIMPALLCLGVCLSTFHQSSLGNLMNIAPYKLHHLWWGAFSPLLFLLSAMMVGLPMVIFTILFASSCLNRKPEMEILTPLARKYVPVFIALYLVVKIVDMAWRGTYRYLGDGSLDGILWMAEMALVIVPFFLFFIPAVTRSAKALGAACLMVILGVVLNRLNVFVLGFHPIETKPYFPSITELMVSMGLVAALLLTYRLAVTYLPILEPRPQEAAA